MALCMPQSTYCEQINVHQHAPDHVAFQLTLDPMNLLDDMGFMNGVMPDILPCAIEFETRILESELRRMMQQYPQNA
ncbi:hypothetical protein BDR07DRAFT_1440136 [Suillus spraguei]|nr:hypothetical protein BDR07DRAFT_1440136 [Suillus spraguei]